jgi:hypothetical protein
VNQRFAKDKPEADRRRVATAIRVLGQFDWLAYALTMFATDRSVSLVVRTVPPLSIGRKIGPDSIPPASHHSRNALAGQALTVSVSLAF